MTVAEYKQTETSRADVASNGVNSTAPAQVIEPDVPAPVRRRFSFKLPAIFGGIFSKREAAPSASVETVPSAPEEEAISSNEIAPPAKENQKQKTDPVAAYLNYKPTEIVSVRHPVAEEKVEVPYNPNGHKIRPSYDGTKRYSWKNFRANEIALFHPTKLTAKDREAIRLNKNKSSGEQVAKKGEATNLTFDL